MSDYEASTIGLIYCLSIIRETDSFLNKFSDMAGRGNSSAANTIDQSVYCLMEAMKADKLSMPGSKNWEHAFGNVSGKIHEEMQEACRDSSLCLLVFPLHYSSKCIISASQTASKTAYENIAAATVSIMHFYSNWDAELVASSLSKAFPDEPDLTKKASAIAQSTWQNLLAGAMAGITQTANQKPNAKKQTGGCYIATAAYGSYDCPQVWTLRRYRDFHLANTFLGSVFIKAYYAISPSIVKRLGTNSLFNRTTRKLLDRLVSNCQKRGYSSEPYSDQNR